MSAASNADQSPVFANNAFGEPEAEAGSGVAFRRVERLKNASHIFLRNSAAIVGEDHAHSQPM